MFRRAARFAMPLLAVACASVPERGAAISAATLEQVPSGAYALGPTNAEVGFSVSPLGIGRIDGKFADFEGVLKIDDASSGTASITAQVRVDSAQMNRDGYVEMLLSPEWFDAANFPFSAFNGRLAGWKQDGAGDFAGEMTIRDVTRTEVFDIRLSCDGLTACPAETIGFSGEVTIDRRAYGMTRWQGVVGPEVVLRVSGTLDVRAGAVVPIVPSALDVAGNAPAAGAADDR